jgi:hypothetical protein
VNTSIELTHVNRVKTRVDYLLKCIADASHQCSNDVARSHLDENTRTKRTGSGHMSTEYSNLIGRNLRWMNKQIRECQQGSARDIRERIIERNIVEGVFFLDSIELAQFVEKPKSIVAFVRFRRETPTARSRESNVNIVLRTSRSSIDAQLTFRRDRLELDRPVSESPSRSTKVTTVGRRVARHRRALLSKVLKSDPNSICCCRSFRRPTRNKREHRTRESTSTRSTM